MLFDDPADTQNEPQSLGGVKDMGKTGPTHDIILDRSNFSLWERIEQKILIPTPQPKPA
jgi:hypothetical protein